MKIKTKKMKKSIISTAVLGCFAFLASCNGGKTDNADSQRDTLKNETADSILDAIVHICAGITGGFARCLVAGQNHILNEHEYREYKELKKQYMASPNLFNANNQTCWNINGAKHCVDFTYEDNKSKIEVKNGSTNITIK